MSSQKEQPKPRGRIGKVIVAIVAGLWAWKTLEIAGRQTGVLLRNLGWGYVVDLTIPAAATIALAVFFIARWNVRQSASAKASRCS